MAVFIGQNDCSCITARIYPEVGSIDSRIVVCRSSRLFQFVNAVANLQRFTGIGLRCEGRDLLPVIACLFGQFESCTCQLAVILIILDDHDLIVRIPVIGVLSAVHVVRLIDGTGYGISAYSTRRRLIIFCIFRLCNFRRGLRLDKLVAVGHACFLNGIGCASRQVEETDIPVSLDTDGELCSGRNGVASCRVSIVINFRSYIR